MKKAALHNLGCKVNAYETQAMQQLLEEAGYEIISFQDKADVYVVNTCSVTNIADRKSRQMLHRARRRNPDAVIVAAGCYVQAAAQDILKEGIADIVLGNNKKNQLIPMLEAYDSGRGAVAWEDINDGVKEYEPLSMTKTDGHTRAFLKIQDGCNQFCSYCIIPYARGRVRSRKPGDVLAEASALAAHGFQEVVLTGIHLSSYGVDFGMEAQESLLSLLAQVHAIPGIRRIRLGSLEPGILTEPFVSGLAGMEKVCPHFHLSLQSGCDTVLERMNRKYSTKDYAARCGMLRSVYKNPAITTDIIVGFPGETEEEFETTVQFVQQVQFYEMHVFKYSRRKGTKADRMDAQVPEPVKAQRSTKLMGLASAMSQAFRSQLVGQVRQVLLEEPFWQEGQRYEAGYTQEYVKVAVKSETSRQNCFVKGKIIGCLAQDIYLMVEF